MEEFLMSKFSSQTTSRNDTNWQRALNFLVVLYDAWIVEGGGGDNAGGFKNGITSKFTNILTVHVEQELGSDIILIPWAVLRIVP